MTEDLRSWLWNKLGEECAANLKKHGFDAHLAANAEEARSLVLKLVSGYRSYGFGGSATTRSLGLPEALAGGGRTVHDHNAPDLTDEQRLEARHAQLRCDCFLCSANAVAATGEIVNVDGAGNRTSALAFGPKKVVVVAGMNKVTADLPSALDRVRRVAAPMRAKSLGLDTPCARTGVCNDCNAPMRICNVTTILHRRPLLTDVSVVLVNEELGY
jgi:L-lactate utilization protein LutB